MFDTFDEYANPDHDYGLYYGFNYSAGLSEVTAASEVQDCLHVGRWFTFSLGRRPG